MFKAHTLLYHSTLGLRVIERRRREDAFTLNLRSTNSGLGVRIVWLVESVMTLSSSSSSSSLLLSSLELSDAKVYEP